MKLEEAIKLLTEYAVFCNPVEDVEASDALKLGIKALKGVEKSRLLWGNRGVPLLPGETKE